MSRFVSLAVLLALIVLLGSTFYRVIAPFLLPLFLAAVLAVICQPLQNRFLKLTRGRVAWAAGLTTASVTLMIVGPLVTLTFVAATHLYTLADQRLGADWKAGLNQVWSKGVMPIVSKIAPLIPGGLSQERLLELQTEFSDSLQSLATQLAGTTFSIASSTVGMFVSLLVAGGMFLTALYYFLADGSTILAAAEELIPLPVNHQRSLRDRFARVVRAVVSATFLAAFAQGLATAVALQVCGIGYFVVFLVIGSVAALIPLAGTWMVWGPCAIWLGLQGHWFAAIGLTVWGIAVVGVIDNLVKMYVLQSEADLHPLIAFISVIGALQVMGLWGIFIGPIVASCLFALLQIFNSELKELARDRDTGATSAASSSAPDPDVVAIVTTQSPAVAVLPVSSSKSHSKRAAARSGRKRRH